MTDHSWTVDEYKEFIASGKEPAGKAKPVEHRKAKGGNRFAGLAKGNVKTRGVMNATEGEWADQLDLQLLAEEIAHWEYEPCRWRTTDPQPGQTATLYTPDFLIMTKDREIIFDDVKGSGPDDQASINRLKAAASKFWMFKFRLVKKKKKADGGGWKITVM